MAEYHWYLVRNSIFLRFSFVRRSMMFLNVGGPFSSKIFDFLISFLTIAKLFSLFDKAISLILACDRINFAGLLVIRCSWGLFDVNLSVTTSIPSEWTFKIRTTPLRISILLILRIELIVVTYQV